MGILGESGLSHLAISDTQELGGHLDLDLQLFEKLTVSIPEKTSSFSPCGEFEEKKIDHVCSFGSAHIPADS